MFDYKSTSDFESIDAVTDYIDHVLGVYDFLKKQSDFSPRNPEINRVLSAFVRDTMKQRDDKEIAAILSSPLIQETAILLRPLLGRAEYEMECYCAAAMAGNIPNAPKHYASYPDFIYRGNYEALVDSELIAMKWRTKCPPLKADRESVAFIGAGPLPISAIMFSQRTGMPVTCIDSDENACRLGSNLIRYLAANEPSCAGIDKKIHFVHAAGEEHDYVTHPVVFIASLIENKAPVVMRIIKTTHTVATTVVRSAEGLSTLLYKPETCVAGQEEYNLYLTGQSKHSSDAINTSLVYKFPPGKYFARNKIDFIGGSDDLTRLTRPVFRFLRTQPHARPI